MELRPYQSEALDAVRANFRSQKRRVIFQASTGAGKTASVTVMIESAAQRGRVTWFVVHRREIIGDVSRRFAAEGIDHGLILPGSPFQPDKRVQVCSVQTLIRRLSRLPAPDMLAIDECHHATASTYRRLLDAYPDAWVIGLTATPQRLDGRGLGEVFQAIVSGPPMKWLIDEGYLARYRLFGPTAPVLDGIKTVGGDYDPEALKELMDRSVITGDAVRTYREKADGRRAMTFCVSVSHSQHVAEEFREAGYRAEHIDSTTPRLVRDSIMQRFRDGDIDVLSQCNLLGEGVDVPALEVAILLRPTKSLTVYLQAVGRALRVKPDGGEAIILDHGGNWLRHGLPDSPREWSLESKKRKKSESETPTIRCEECYRIFETHLGECPECGWQVPAPDAAETRDGPRHVAGTLSEISEDVLSMLRTGPLRDALVWATDEPGVRLIAKLRGYHHGWVKHIMLARARAASERLADGI